MKYLNEIIEFNGICFKVLDSKNIDFTDAQFGIKSAITKVVKAKGGEKIETKNNSGEIETITVAEAGDAIFCNNEIDVYIPHNSDGSSWKFDDLESKGYNIVSADKDAVFIQSNNKAALLVGVIKEPTCIKDAWGEGAHQFLYQGATLKKDLKTNKVTGIDKDAFESTWLVLDSESDKEISE